MKKIMMIFVLAMVAMVGKAETKTVSYWDSADKKMRTKECERITADTRTLVSGTWYYVEGSVEMNHGLEIGHYAYIILEDDAKLVINAPANTPGIAVRYGTLRTDYLYVYGQRSGTGKMEVHGGANAAGIGGICVDGENRHMGYMYVYGGIIEAYGGKNAAGIGGSYFKNNEGEVYVGDGSEEFCIYGGTVRAFGGDGAPGVGGANGKADQSDLYLYGGSLEAQGGNGCKGIGAGGADSGTCIVYSDYAAIWIKPLPVNAFNFVEGRTELCLTEYMRIAGLDEEVTADTGTLENDGWYYVDEKVERGTITVNGSAHLVLGLSGELKVSGDYSCPGLEVSAGNSIEIFSSVNSVLTAQGGYKAAGIGGGDGGSGGNVTINGGTVNANGGQFGAGIGGGNEGAGGTVTINGGTVNANGGRFGAGIGGGNHGSSGTVTINVGTVTATGGEYGAGIGGGDGGSGGNVTINGGTVEAKGVGGGAGIGGGNSGAGGTVTINGGTVTATGSDNGVVAGCSAAIGCGDSGRGGMTTINGGTVTAEDGGISGLTLGSHAFTVDNQHFYECANVSFELPAGLQLQSATSNWKDGVKVLADGPIHTCYVVLGSTLTLEFVTPDIRDEGETKTVTIGSALTDITLRAGDLPSVRRRTPLSVQYESASGLATAQAYPVIPSRVPSDLVLSNDWYVATGIVTVATTRVMGKVNLILADGAQLTVNGGIWAEGDDALTIYGQGEGTGHLIANGVNESRAGIGGGTVTIYGGTVTATGGNLCAGIGGGYYAAGSTVTINGGTVNANGGDWGAGIGGGEYGDGGTVTINGGAVTAQGNGGGAGIGGGFNGSGGTTMINGGTVTAQGDWRGAGIGGGGSGSGGTTMINGGTVTAQGGDYAVGIGGGYDGLDGTMAIGGGSIKASSIGGQPTNTQGKAVYKVTVPLPSETDPTKPVKVEGLEDYGCEDLYPLDDGKLYLYLPNGRYGLIVNGTPYIAVVKDGATTVQPAYTITVGDLRHMSATCAPSVSFAPIGDGCFLIEQGAENVEIVFTADRGYALDGATIVRIEKLTGDITFGDGNDYAVPTAVVPYQGWDAERNQPTNAFRALEDCTFVTSETTEFVDGGWYAVVDDVEITGTNITVTGDAHLILCNGAKLSITAPSACAAIDVSKVDGVARSLTIYGQASGPGELTVNGGEAGAGIGGSNGRTCGKVTINGGIVTAQASRRLGASIGGGWKGGGGQVTINGGTVTATDFGCGVSGYSTGNEGTLTINGGSVNTQGGSPKNAAGEDLHLVMVELPDGAWVAGQPVEIKGLKNYGTQGIVPIWGHVYLYLPNGAYSFIFDGKRRYVATVDGKGTTAILGEEIEYVDADGSLKTKQAYEFVSSETTEFTDGWYVVREDVTISGHKLTVSGAAHLILFDGAKLTVTNIPINHAAIDVSAIENVTNSLSIYGQRAGTGELRAFGGQYAAGIGGGYNCACGTVTINGGTVFAQGDWSGAGIGGGDLGDGGTVTVNGGTVTANGDEYSAGIGGGSGGAGGTVTVNGGTVTATGGKCGAGIGGGENGAGGTVTVNGGTMTAQGKGGGAGIGGGEYGAGGTVRINGGNVEATGSGYRGAAIGAGNGNKSKGTVTWDSSKVQIVEGGTGYKDQYVKFVEKPLCEGGTIAMVGGVWVVTPNAGVTEIKIAELAAGEMVAVPPTVKKVIGVNDEQIRIREGEKDITEWCTIKDGVIARDVCTVTVGGDMTYLTAAWTSGNEEVTNAIENGSFEVGCGTLNVKVLFTPAHNYQFKSESEDGVRALTSPLIESCTVTAPEVEGIPGTEVAPWKVGENVTAYVSDEGVLVVGGEGAMDDFASVENVPWKAAEIKEVTIAEGVTQIGKNALTGLADAVTVNGTPLSTYRVVSTVETAINGMSLATYNTNVRYLNVGEEWKEAAPASSSEPVISEDMVLVSKTEIEAAKATTIQIVDGMAYLDVNVSTNADLTAEIKNWGKVKLDPATVKQAADGHGLVVPVPAKADKGFMILRSGEGR